MPITVEKVISRADVAFDVWPQTVTAKTVFLEACKSKTEKEIEDLRHARAKSIHAPMIGLLCSLNKPYGVYAAAAWYIYSGGSPEQEHARQKLLLGHLRLLTGLPTQAELSFHTTLKAYCEALKTPYLKKEFETAIIQQSL